MIRYFHLRFATIFAMLLLAAAMVAAPSQASAQDDQLCRCDYITVNVDVNVICKVTVCALTPDGARNCVTIAPGTRARLRCTPGATVYIYDCHNNLVPLNPVTMCERGIGAGPNCCTVDACFDPSDTVCTVITITPSILDVCPCL
jgi:hypothetical protein